MQAEEHERLSERCPGLGLRATRSPTLEGHGTGPKFIRSTELPVCMVWPAPS